MPRFAIKASLVAAAAFAAGVAVGPVQQVVAQAGSGDTFRQLKLFGDVFERVRAEYVEEVTDRSEEHTSELQSRQYLVCRLLLEKKKKIHDHLSVHHEN